MMRALMSLGIVLAGACKLEPIESVEIRDESALGLPSHVQPWSIESAQHGGDGTRWDLPLRQLLGFVTGPQLQGRRPGASGASLTVGLIISEFERAGLSPNGPDLGWTQPVGVRVVETTDVSLTIRRPAGAGEPETLRFEENLWLRHRGAAGLRRSSMEIVEPKDGEPRVEDETEPSVDALERLLVLSSPVLAQGAEHRLGYGQVFDDAWHDGMSVAILPIPRDEPGALAVALAWREPDIQSLLLGRDPPAALDLQGFVDPSVHLALTEAAAIPGALAELEYESTERWFQDDNVIARIAGGRHPEQAVVVVAAWDDGGLAAPLSEGGGASHAGGLAVLLALARNSGRWEAAGRRPGRSLVFVAEAGGSLGHRGIARFVEASGIRPENIIAVLNLERLGGDDASLAIVDGHRSSLGLQVGLADATARMIDDEGNRHGHVPFLERGIPAVTLTRPVAATDEGQEAVLSIATLRADAQLIFLLLWTLADQAETPRLSEPEPTLGVDE